MWFSVSHVSLKLLQFRWAQALVHAWFRHVAKWRNDVAIPVKADLLAHLKATEKQAEIRDNLHHVGCKATPKSHDALVLDDLSEAVYHSIKMDINSSTLGQKKTLGLE